MNTLLCNSDGDIMFGVYDPPENILLRLEADTYTPGSSTWSDQSGNGLDFTVSTNTSLKSVDSDGFPFMDFNGSYGIAKRIVGGALTNITAPTTNKYTIFCVCRILNSTTTWRTLIRGSDHQVIVQSGNNNLGLYDGGGSNFVDSGFDVTPDMTGNRNLLVWELSTTTPIYNFQLNESGTNSTITSASNYTLPFSCIGGYHNNSTVITTSSQYWGGIYEFIVIDGHLSVSNRSYISEYLAYKWGISSKLLSFTSTQGLTTLKLGVFDYVSGSEYTSTSSTLYSNDTSNDWITVYEITNPSRNTSGVIEYIINNSSLLSSHSYTRVGYLLTHKFSGQSKIDWVFCTFSKWSSTITDLRVPDQVDSFTNQRNVTNLNVYSSNQTAQPNRNNVSGRLEIWPYNYSATQSGLTPSGSNTQYDYDDTSSGSGTYGSFQVHDVTNGVTCLAWNSHGFNATPCIGIGNNVSGNPFYNSGGRPDWTFANNHNNDFTLKIMVM